MDFPDMWSNPLLLHFHQEINWTMIKVGKALPNVSSAPLYTIMITLRPNQILQGSNDENTSYQAT